MCITGRVTGNILTNIGGHEVFGHSTVRPPRLGVQELPGGTRLERENRRLRDEQRHLHVRLLQGILSYTPRHGYIDKSIWLLPF